MSFKIRQANVTDVERVAPLFDQYRQFYFQASNLDLARQFIQERLKNSDSVIFIAVNDDENNKSALGFVQLYPSFSSVQASCIWILNDLFISETSRQSGVAKALLRHTKAFAISTGATEITLSTAQGNHSAQKLYVAEGYEKDSQFLQFFLSL